MSRLPFGLRPPAFVSSLVTAVAFIAVLLVLASCSNGNTPTTAPTSAPVPTNPPQATVIVPSATQAPGAQPNMVRSYDGTATLAIPPGSLPPGVTPKDVRITTLSPGQAPVLLEGQPPLAAFSIEPDGAKFSQPLTLTLILPKDNLGQGLPSLWTLSGDTVEALDGVWAISDTGKGTVTLTVGLSHLSTYYAWAGPFALDMYPPDKEIVGASFPVEVTIREGYKDHPPKSINGDFKITYGFARAWEVVNGKFDAWDSIRPAFVDDVPKYELGQARTASGVGTSKGHGPVHMCDSRPRGGGLQRKGPLARNGVHLLCKGWKGDKASRREAQRNLLVRTLEHRMRGADPDPHTDTDTFAYPRSNPYAYTDVDRDPSSYHSATSDANPNADALAYSFADADRDAHTVADADCDTHTVANTYTHSDVGASYRHTYAHTDSDTAATNGGVDLHTYGAGRV